MRKSWVFHPLSGLVQYLCNVYLDPPDIAEMVGNVVSLGIAVQGIVEVHNARLGIGDLLIGRDQYEFSISSKYVDGKMLLFIS